MSDAVHCAISQLEINVAKIEEVIICTKQDPKTVWNCGKVLGTVQDAM